MSNSKISALTSATTPLAGTEVLPIVQSSATVKVATNDLTVRNVRAAATTGILQVSGPSAASTRTMTVPDANFTAARTDAAQTFSAGASINIFDGTGTQIVGFSKNAGNRMYLSVTSNVDESITFVQSGGGNVLKVGNNYDVTVINGNLIQGTAAKGINFTANTPASGMTSQLLNWYEEGTWTPADASGASLTFSSVTATYTRNGRCVYITATITYPTTADVSQAKISGLPFTSSATGQLIFVNPGINVLGAGQGWIASGSTTLTLVAQNNAAKTNTNLSTLVIYISGVYQV